MKKPRKPKKKKLEFKIPGVDLGEVKTTASSNGNNSSFFLDLNESTQPKPPPVNPIVLLTAMVDLLMELIILDRFIRADGSVDQEAAQSTIRELRKTALMSAIEASNRRT